MPIERLNVLNPGGRDPCQSYAGGMPAPSRSEHAPVNFHAYAACTGGDFLNSIEAACADTAPVLLLLRKNLRHSLSALKRLKTCGRCVIVAFKETGLHQVAGLFKSSTGLTVLRKIAGAADGLLAPVSWLVPIYRSLADDVRRVAFIPTPYPVGLSEWAFSKPLAGRNGLFVGTRKFSEPTRRHAAALTVAAGVARDLGVRVSVFNTEGRRGRKLIATIVGDADVVVHERALAYPDYLEAVASHRLVMQMDASEVPGQVAGDALLCGMPCLGGNGTVESLAFPAFAGSGVQADTLDVWARRLLSDDTAWMDAVADSQRLARERLGFESVARQLGEFLATICG